MLSLMSSVLLGFLFLGAALALSFASYFLARHLLDLGQTDRHRAMADSAVARIAVLQGLILALVFAQEMAGYQRLQGVVAAEANAVADIWHDAGRWGPEPLADLRSLSLDYLRAVTGEEWRQLGRDGGLSASAWIAWDGIYREVLDLQPGDPAQEALRANMLDRVHDIAAARDQRGKDGTGSVFVLFWIAAIGGLVLVSAAHFPHPPDRQNLAMLGFFAAYTGLILYLIFAFQNPYQEPAALRPASLERLLDAFAAEGGGQPPG